MQAADIVVWKEGDAWLGYLQEYPDCWTQGDSLDDLKEHLLDIRADLLDIEIVRHGADDNEQRADDV